MTNAEKFKEVFPNVEPQEWISPTVEPVSTEEAKKLLYQEFKGKMKDDNPRLLVAYEIAMKALETQTEWIPVTERLPEKSGLYLVSTGDLVTTLSFCGHSFRTHFADEYGVDAWRPLPKPYKGDAE